jgi:hypothetical protein
MTLNALPSISPARLSLLALLALGTTACGGPATPTPEATPAVQAMPAEPSTDVDTAEAVAMDEAAALAAREQELAAKEAELALREREAELARREAELAAREAAAKTPAKAPAPTKVAATPKPAVAAPAAAAPPAPPPTPVTVPAGTQFTVELTAPLSTKTAVAGEPVQARLASDLVVGDRRVARAGAAVRGTVREVTSGSKKVGAVPALRLEFTELALADGTTATINARAAQKGVSEKGRDTAKIAGGTAAGAIIGHQVDDDKGKVIGGLIGGAAGAVAAARTGTEVELAAGATLSAALRSEFVYTGR